MISNYAYFPILIQEDYGLSRDELHDLLKKYGIYSRKYFYPLTSDQACFKNKYKKCRLENARRLAKQVLVIPLYDTLEENKIYQIIKIITDKESIDEKYIL